MQLNENASIESLCPRGETMKNYRVRDVLARHGEAFRENESKSGNLYRIGQRVSGLPTSGVVLLLVLGLGLGCVYVDEGSESELENQTRTTREALSASEGISEAEELLLVEQARGAATTRNDVSRSSRASEASQFHCLTENAEPQSLEIAALREPLDETLRHHHTDQRLSSWVDEDVLLPPSLQARRQEVAATLDSLQQRRLALNLPPGDHSLRRGQFVGNDESNVEIRRAAEKLSAMFGHE
jgi:hypothetical protein